MGSEIQQGLEEYRKFLVSRLSVGSHFTDFVEKCITSESEAAKHSFHKIMIHNWGAPQTDLFDNLSEYLSVVFIPVQYSVHVGIASFYTSNLSVIMKIIKHDFMFAFRRNMFNIDILFNDKTSLDCFGSALTLEEIVAGVVSRRFNEKCELDLSNFASEFEDKNINFYKLSLLSIFRLLMIRMGRDTKLLNLSNNKLSAIPSEILNFFRGGRLIGVDLSNNYLQSMSDVRLLSTIERLWLEGNPLCDSEECRDPLVYVKQMTMKFPRLQELDGIVVNQCGLIFPFWRNYTGSDVRLKMLVEKFLTLYFSHYDSAPRKKIASFYGYYGAMMTLQTRFTEAQEKKFPHYASHSRNILDPAKRKFVLNSKLENKYAPNKQYRQDDNNSRRLQIQTYLTFPESTHDPKSFTVDSFRLGKLYFIIIDGIFKETTPTSQEENYFHFRRSIVLVPTSSPPTGASIVNPHDSTVFNIANEMLTISVASEQQVRDSFRHPTMNLNKLALVSPTQEDLETFCSMFGQISQLKKQEIEIRLRVHNWDFRKTLLSFIDELRNNRLTADKFLDAGDSDLSGLDDDDMVD